MKTKIYLAGPWFTEKADILEKYAYSMYEATNCEDKIEVFRPRTDGKDTPFETFMGNLEAIDNAHIVIAQVSEKDVGTAFEIGYARAKGKDIILVGFDEKDFAKKTNLMLAFAGDQCITIDKLWKIFSGTIDYCDDTVKTDKFDEWRNIE